MKILVPISFEESSLNGLEYALMLAASGDHSITTLHVIAPQKTHSTKLSHRMHELELEDDKEFHKEALSAFLSKLSNPDFQFADHLVRRGDMAKRILIESMDNFDLVVMGTKGGSKLVETFFGSDSFNYLKISAIPTIVVPRTWSLSTTKKACISLRFDNLYSEISSTLMTISKALGYSAELMTVVDKSQDDLSVSIHHGGATIPVTIYEGKRPIQMITKHIEENDVRLLALHFNTYSLVTSLTQTSASQEFSFRGPIPILFAK